MAVLKAEELIARVKERLGDDTSDEAISFLEDVSDTVNANADAENWKQKYEENDKAWREKYISRFSGGDDKPDDEEEDVEEEKLTYEDLFKEVD